MTPIEAINKLLRDTVNLILASSNYAIKAKQKDAPRPLGSYGDIDYVVGIDLGWEQREYEDNVGDDNVTEFIKGLREITMSLNFYRDNAVDNARLVRTAVVRESIQALFRAAGVGLTSRSEVREISEPLENGWEERAQFDIVLSVVGNDQDIINTILSVDISGEHQSNGNKYNFNIKVQ